MGCGHTVTLWCRDPKRAKEISRVRENTKYLAGITLSKKLGVTSVLADAMQGADFVVAAMPSHTVRDVVRQCTPYVKDHAVIVSAAKGLLDSGETIDAAYRELLPPHIADNVTYLSGPNFAREIAKGLPGAAVVAGNAVATSKVQSLFSGSYFRVYTSSDSTGVLLGGALKNIVAIACGVSDGMGFGLNARAGAITRGLAEIRRLGVLLGADSQTFSGLSGVGDLLLTCTGDLSRNRMVGLELAKGKSLQQIIQSMHMVAEGVRTTKVTHALAKENNVDMPITAAMYLLLYEGHSCYSVCEQLFHRAVGLETE